MYVDAHVLPILILNRIKGQKKKESTQKRLTLKNRYLNINMTCFIFLQTTVYHNTVTPN
jgi:hypothetical protein